MRVPEKSRGGDGQPILHGAVTAEGELRYAMSLPGATTISGMNSLEALQQNLRIVRGFAPMTPEEMQALRRRCAPFAADGHLELCKSTKGAVGRNNTGIRPRTGCPSDPPVRQLARDLGRAPQSRLG
jgi:uncharacterized protein